MISTRKIEKYLDEDNLKSPFKKKNVDYNYLTISLLRQAIPYKYQNEIPATCEKEKLYLCELNTAADWLDEEQLAVLQDCNVAIENGWLIKHIGL